MKKLIIILLALVVVTGYANTDTNTDLSGIAKLKTKWYKLIHHESKLKIEKDCSANPEVIHITKKDNQYFLVHSLGVETESFQIIKCVTRPTNNSVEQTLDLELIHPVTGQIYQVVVKYSIDQTMWKGLTSPNSTHLFTSEEATGSFDSIIKTCE